MVVLRTFSKAWGMAAARIGIAIGDPSVAALFDRIKLPYNLSELAQQVAMEALDRVDQRDAYVAAILAERAWLEGELSALPSVEHVYPSDANFVLARFEEARGTV